MSKSGQATMLSALLLLFVGTIVVLAIIPEMASNIQKMKARLSVVNESIDIGPARVADGTINESYAFSVANAPKDSGDWRASDGDVDCPLSDFSILNATGSAFTENTDYIVDLAEGNFTLKYTAATNQSGSINQTYVSYSYCDAGYITDSAGRSIVSLILVFAALGLVGFAVYYGIRGWVK